MDGLNVTACWCTESTVDGVVLEETQWLLLLPAEPQRRSDNECRELGTEKRTDMANIRNGVLSKMLKVDRLVPNVT
uniref:Uncharacterized protein n=1 Tax=Pristionchus pacificus TaxID=54126 RepID=A0A2A6CKZ4_PRIPA|eukprot:PDM78789.1 hypothetical protein PRIPAC_31368 [Pristionchus pacificus]